MATIDTINISTKEVLDRYHIQIAIKVQGLWLFKVRLLIGKFVLFLVQKLVGIKFVMVGK